MKNALLALAAASTLSGCASIYDLPTERLGQAQLSYANGLPAGTAQLMTSGNSYTLAIAVTGMSAGPHGLHLHTVGTCEAPDFKSAGGHLNPTGKTHGTMSPDGSHLGDLPNLVVNANGTGTATIDLEAVSSSDLGEIFDADGTAVVIHAGPDDYRTDPAGAAGARIACGVLAAIVAIRRLARLQPSPFA